MKPYLDKLVCHLEQVNQQLKILESALNLVLLDEIERGKHTPIQCCDIYRSSSVNDVGKTL